MCLLEVAMCKKCRSSRSLTSNLTPPLPPQQNNTLSTKIIFFDPPSKDFPEIFTPPQAGGGGGGGVYTLVVISEFSLQVRITDSQPGQLRSVPRRKQFLSLLL